MRRHISLFGIVLIALLINNSCKKVYEIDIAPNGEIYTGAIPLDSNEYKKIPLISPPLIAARTAEKVTLAEEYIIPYMPPVGNQMTTGSCVGWAVGYAARSAIYNKFSGMGYDDGNGRTNADAVFSPAFIYNSLNKGINSGILTNEAIDFVQHHGVCKWRDMPFQNSHLPPPNDAQKQKALPFKIKNWGRINIDLKTIQQFVFFDIPVIVVLRLDDNFVNLSQRLTDGAFLWNKYDPNATLNPETKKHRYHAVVIAGYSKKDNAFLIQNSWGQDWHKKAGESLKIRSGYIWMDYQLLKLATKEAYVMLTDDQSKQPPIIETLAASGITDKKAKLNGVVRSLGDTPIQIHGFLMSEDSTKLRFDYIESSGSYLQPRGATYLLAKGTIKPPQPYDVDYDFVGSRKKYFRAFGRSYNGVYYGKILNFEPIGLPDDPIANDTQERSTASSNGDPHISTFDGASFSFMAAGEFTVLKSTSDNFEIQARQEEVKSLNNDGTVSWNTGLAIRTGNDKVCFYPPNRVFLNGQNLGNSFQSQSLSNGGMIVKDGSTFVVTTANQDEIKVYLRNVNLDYYVTPNQNRRGKLQGVLGNFDEQPQNDLQIQGGEVIKGTYNELYPRYADSWRIKQSESLFIYDTGKNTDTYTDRNFPRTSLNLTSAQRNAAKTICEKAGVTDPILLENCIIDVASTSNNTSLAEHYYEAQVSTQVLESFSIGGFSSSDVKLGYSGVTVTNKEAVLDTRLKSPAIILMRQGVDIRTGFVTEFSFSTNTLHPTSCFYLALWPTDIKFRSESQNRIGFCFAVENGVPTTFFLDPYSKKIAKKQINNFIDGKNHKVKIVETQLTNRKWRVQLFLDNMFVPQFSVDNDQSIADMIRTPDKVGFIELQINQGVPSAVKVFNWSYDAL